jgi:asparagine synthetase B (glutamine-hydrolysing)
VIYDNKHKQPFAARDPSGEECLYYHISEDGAVSFASSRLEIPDGEQPHEWRELPPGHYISGVSWTLQACIVEFVFTSCWCRPAVFELLWRCLLRGCTQASCMQQSTK